MLCVCFCNIASSRCCLISPTLPSPPPPTLRGSPAASEAAAASYTSPPPPTLPPGPPIVGLLLQPQKLPSYSSQTAFCSCNVCLWSVCADCEGGCCSPWSKAVLCILLLLFPLSTFSSPQPNSISPTCRTPSPLPPSPLTQLHPSHLSHPPPPIFAVATPAMFVCLLHLQTVDLEMLLTLSSWP